MGDLPEHTRIYQNHHLDSTRWDGFEPRDGDIIIVTPYKGGTTWTQAIVANLLFPGGAFPAPVWQMSPWLDSRVMPIKEVLARFSAQKHQRMIKTHLPIDGLPFYPQCKYIFVSRDGRDVFMSFWNHYSNYTDAAYDRFNGAPGRVGPPLPRATFDIHECWRQWCTRGWFDWESDGWPFWSALHLTQSWWDYRHLPNIVTLHYGDMKKDTPVAIARIAAFLDIEVSDPQLAAITDAVSLDAMREQGQDYVPRGGELWKGGTDTFLNKGTNGRWRDVLSAEELKLYDGACDRALSDDCRAWLKNGGPIS